MNYDRHTYRAKDKHGHWRYGAYLPATTDCAPYSDESYLAANPYYNK